MTKGQSGVDQRAAELRAAFDRSFSVARDAESSSFESILALRVAGDPYAIRISEVAGLFADKSVTRLPSSVSDLLGIVGFRGGLVPVYDLRLLLGYPAAEHPRWLVLARADQAVALAFDRFEGHLRVAREDIVAANGVESSQQEGEVVRSVDVVRPILHVLSVVEALKARANQRAREELRR